MYTYIPMGGSAGRSPGLYALSRIEGIRGTLWGAKPFRHLLPVGLGSFGASKRPAWGSRMTPWSCQCSESHLDRSGGIVSPGSPAAANAEL